MEWKIYEVISTLDLSHEKKVPLLAGEQKQLNLKENQFWNRTSERERETETCPFSLLFLNSIASDFNRKLAL